MTLIALKTTTPVQQQDTYVSRNNLKQWNTHTQVECYALTTKMTENVTNRSSSTSQLKFDSGFLDLSATQSKTTDGPSATTVCLVNYSYT